MVIQTLSIFFFFFFNDTATTEIYTLSLHDALPISGIAEACRVLAAEAVEAVAVCFLHSYVNPEHERIDRSEEHTSELQSHLNIVCRLLLVKKKKIDSDIIRLERQSRLKVDQ